MTAVTDVIIFFVGLTMWSDQLPNDCGVKAILPHIVHTRPSDPAALDPPHVPDHVAAIVFPAESFVSVDGWGEPMILGSGPGTTTGTPPPGPVYKYIPLDGDTVRFITSGITNDPVGVNGLKLPHLQRDLCPARQGLTSPYQLPYGGAAAVVALPHGVLRACLSMPASAGRLDAQLALKTAGTLVISASTMRNPKELRLRPRIAGGPIEVMIANLPASDYGIVSTMLRTEERNLMPHQHAYYGMSWPSDSSCTLSLSEWWNQLTDPDGIYPCNSSMSAAFARDPPTPVAGLVPSGANFECSNTRWP